MKLDPTVLRNMTRQDFRVLTAVETGMKTHELVPAPLIASIANLRHGGSGKILSSLLRDKLLSHDRSCGYDGYRLTTSGYDIMALENLKARGIVAALGDKIGTGKESDVYLAASSDGKQVVLKFHRLGRTSFRDVKKKRDYFNVNNTSRKGNSTSRQQPNSWLFLSRISALKEFAFMKALYEVGYSTPQPIGHNRHIVAMGLVRGMPLYQIHVNRVSAEQAESIFHQSISLASRLAAHGLVHCDLNEFNLMVDLSGVQNIIADDNDVAEHYVRHSGMSVASKGVLSAHGPLLKHQVDGTGEIISESPPEPKDFLESGEPKPIVTLIDFPQMVSTRHPNAKELFDRDLMSLKRFFMTKLKCIPGEEWDNLIPKWETVVDLENDNKVRDINGVAENEDNAKLRLDKELRASGFSEMDAYRDMELYYYTQDDLRGLPQEVNVDSDEEDEERHDEFKNPIDKTSEFPTPADPYFTDEIAEPCNKSQEDLDKNPNSTFIVLDDEQRSLITSHSRAIAEEKARARVREHLEERRRKSDRKNAFHSRNNNKTFVKGKRIHTDHGL
jgi:RIO kinase 2